MRIEKLYPECKNYIWGGNKLKEKYGKQTDKTPCAESWELSFHKDGLTRLANGKTLAESVTEQELGENVKGFPFFLYSLSLSTQKIICPYKCIRRTNTY